MKNSSVLDAADLKRAPGVFVTCGERMNNASVIDLVMQPSGLALVLYDGKSDPVIQSTLEVDGVRYHPPMLHTSVLNAIYFPRSIDVTYETDTQLFWSIARVFEEKGALSPHCAAFFAAFTFATWFTEPSVIPPTMRLFAASRASAIFQLLRAFTRRGLPVPWLQENLPFFLQPTLLVDERVTSQKRRAFWITANRPDMFVPGPKGTLRQFVSPRVFLLPPGESADENADAVDLVLAPIEPPVLGTRLMEELMAEFQPKLQMLRLRRFGGENGSPPVFGLKNWPHAVRALLACVPNDPEIIQTLTPLLESQQEEFVEQSLRDPQVAVVRAIWVPAHRPGNMSVADIAARTNALLRESGEFRQYNAHEIGWLLRRLRLYTRRSRSCRVLDSGDDVRHRVHQLAAQFGLQLPGQEGCGDCTKSADPKPVV